MNGSHRLLIVGGGPAGFAAARGYRAAGGERAVAIVADEERAPYERPPLTKGLLRGETTEAELPIENEHWLVDNHVELIGGSVADLRLEPERTATLVDGRELGFERCLLATGAEPRRLPVPGANHPAVRVLRSLDHVREIQRRLADAAEAVVVGSGFIGCEAAASLARRGNDVTMIADEAAPNVERLGEAAAARIADWLREEGVVLLAGTELDRIEHEPGRLEVVAGDRHTPADLVVVAVGVAPRGRLGSLLGLELTDEGAIPADSSMRTVADDVLAAGDVCQAYNAAAGRALRVEHWGDALAQGEIAGRGCAGESASWDSVPGFWSTIGDRTIKHAAWGDGFDAVRFIPHAGGAFTAWYGLDGRVVGVLTHEADEDYESGKRLIADGAEWR